MSSKSSYSQPVDIITYRYRGNLVYVRPSIDYEEAIAVAQKEFPRELGHVPADQIIFVITALMNGTRQPVRISESAWTATVCRMVRGEIIDINVASSGKDDCDAPPRYLEVPDVRQGRISKSTPTSPSPSRHPSPVGRRERSVSPRSWFGVTSSKA